MLQQAGGIDAIRSALIDDCALAALLKAKGPIWLGLTSRVRNSANIPIGRTSRYMVSRTAYAQLRYSPLMLAGTVAGLTLVYLVPPLAALFGTGLHPRLRPRGLGDHGAGVPADAAVLPPLAVVGLCASGHCRRLPRVHLQSAIA